MRHERPETGSTETAITAHDVLQQRRRIRRTTLLLALVALSIYVAFIASGVLKAQP